MAPDSTIEIAQSDRDSVQKPRGPWWARLGSFVLHQLLALAIFVGFPALVTAIAPVSWIKFERQEGQVSATAQTCLLFFVPYKTIHLDPVTGIGDRFVAGTTTRERRTGRDRVTKSEDEGFLVIHSSDQSAEISVTPFNIKSVTERSQGFLDDPQAKELKLFVVANWKFSVIAGGLVSLLTVLYVVVLVGGLAGKLLGLLRPGPAAASDAV
jgi:hypothetical protein